MYRYMVRNKDIDYPIASADKATSNCRYDISDAVWIKPQRALCDARYNTGSVIGIVSEQAV